MKLDHEDTALLLRHHERQQRREAELVEAWFDSGKVFTRPDGSPLRPSWIGERFAQHIAAASLPPIRLHDCRHTAATMPLAIGTDIKVVQRMFGHSTRSTTSDIYTSVLNELLAEAAGSLVTLIPRSPGPRGASSSGNNSAPKELVSSGGGDRL
ncbi:tyrosine-type recombinase/integrase [Amycolatopsis pigmentata]|uniref:Tyrosine-type recombinase/integrase n=1 Tax=Amycolatopsis pigmentata TaxID=450801 RepID=A0ABW5G515_9PSEU